MNVDLDAGPSQTPRGHVQSGGGRRPLTLTSLRCNFGAFPPPTPAALPEWSERSVLDLDTSRNSSSPAPLVDVRDDKQFSICSLSGALNLPLKDILRDPDRAKKALEAVATSTSTIFVLCRRGIDSRVATLELHKLGFERACDVNGGLVAWRAQVDPAFPVY